MNTVEEKIQEPKDLSFWWWYTWAWLGLIFGNIFLLFGLDITISLALAAVTINTVLMIMTLRENKYAFLIATIISLNPVLWLVNGIYLYRRWDHPALNKSSKSPEIGSEAKKSFKKDRISSTRSAPSMEEEERVYEHVARELESDQVKKGLWAKAFAEADGNEQMAKARYIKMRSEQLLVDLRMKNQVSDTLHDEKREETGGEQSSSAETPIDRQRAMDDLIKIMKSTSNQG